MAQREKLIATTVPKNDGVDCLNLVEFPLSVLSTSPPKNKKTLEFTETKFIEGKPQIQKLTITGSDKFGLPTITHHKVLVALLQLFGEQGRFAKPRIEFTRYALLKKLGWSDTAHYYKVAREALCIWKGVNLFYENAWWVDGRFKTKGFSIIDDFELYENKAKCGRRTREEQENNPSYVVFGSVVAEEFRKERTKGLDYGFYLSLNSAVSQQLYRYLGKWFWYGAVFRHPNVRVFACEKIGVSRNYDLANQKRLLDKGIRELTERGYLRKGKFSCRYTKSGGIELWRNTLSQSLVGVPTRSPLEVELEKRGVTGGKGKATYAGSLVEKFDAQLISTKIEVLDWLLTQNDPRVKKNPPGYLVDSIRLGWPNPPEYKPKGEQAIERAERARTCKRSSVMLKRLQNNWQRKEQGDEAQFAEFLASLKAKGGYEAFAEQALGQRIYRNYFDSSRSKNRPDEAEAWQQRAMKALWTKNFRSKQQEMQK